MELFEGVFETTGIFWQICWVFPSKFKVWKGEEIKYTQRWQCSLNSFSSNIKSNRFFLGGFLSGFWGLWYCTAWIDELGIESPRYVRKFQLFFTLSTNHKILIFASPNPFFLPFLEFFKRSFLQEIATVTHVSSSKTFSSSEEIFLLSSHSSWT